MLNYIQYMLSSQEISTFIHQKPLGCVWTDNIGGED